MVGQEELHQMELKKMLRRLQRGVRRRLAIFSFRRCPWHEASSTRGSGSPSRMIRSDASWIFNGARSFSLPLAQHPVLCGASAIQCG